MSEIKPTTYQEAAALGGIWVYETIARYDDTVVLLGTIAEGEDDFACEGEDPGWWCELHVIQVLQGGPWPHQSLGGIRVSQLRRPDSLEQFRVLGDLEDEKRELTDKLVDLAKLADLVNSSPVDPYEDD